MIDYKNSQNNFIGALLISLFGQFLCYQIQDIM